MRGFRNQALIDRLALARQADGGWGYSSNRHAAAEPTAWASLGLSAHGVAPEHYRHGLDHLSRIQRPDGGVPALATVESPCWATGSAVLAWTRAGVATNRMYDKASRRGAGWLLQHAGKPAPHNPTIYGHDTSLIGWSWVDGTHSWVEPTAYALLALDAVGRGDDPRIVEGRRLLQDRMIPGGGWNYGNARMFGAALWPFPETTSVALLALASSPIDARIESSMDYLLAELPRVRSPMSVAWGVMALTAWNRRPAEADTWLAETTERTLQDEFNPLYAALLLLADLEPCPFTTSSKLAEVPHG